jgi:DNA polymerase
MTAPARKRKLLKQIATTEKSFGVDAWPRTKWSELERGLDAPVKPDNRSWDELEKQAKACTQCRLAKTRTEVVFGSGSRTAQLMFVGEAPGADEDEQGLPFVGRAGQLLTKIIEAMGIKREDVYIANCLKCRPPENRPPQPDEINACNSFLLRQVALIKPKVICALGKHAAQTLLRTETPIGELRGNFFDYHGVKLMPTYHPAYLLRNPAEKATVWKDCQLIMKELGLPLPKK